MAVDLKSLKPTATRKPPIIVIYGVNGCGKSSFGAPTEYGMGSENPIYMNLNNGIDTLDVASIKVNNYADCKDFLTALITQDHEYKTLFVDAADDMERVIFEEVVRTAPTPKDGTKINVIGDIGWNKGYEDALDYWKKFLDTLTMIRDKKNMTIVVLAQLDMKKYNDITGDSYEIYTPKLHGSTVKGDTAVSMFMGWADIVGMLKREKITITDENSVAVKGGKKKLRAACSGDLFLYTVETAGFKAKNRYDLPEKINVSENGWQELHSHIDIFWNKKKVKPEKEPIEETTNNNQTIEE